MDQQNTLNQQKNRISVINRPILPVLQQMMILYLVVWSISPPLEIDNIYRVIALVCAVGWFIFDMAQGLKLERIHLYALGFLLMVVLINIIQNNISIDMLMKPIGLYMLVIAFIMNHSYQNRWDELRMLIPVFILLLIIFNIITFRELVIDHTLARRIVRADESIYPYMRRGVGGYALVYCQVILFPVILGWIKCAWKLHRVYFVLGILWIVSYFLLITNAGYSIAVIVTIIAFFILFFYKKNSVVPAVVLSLVLIVIFVLLIGYVEPFRNLLEGIFKGTATVRKINDIYDSLHGVDTADSIQLRLNAYKESLLTIIQYPIIGGLWTKSGGGHSSILDTFAQYGVWGGIVYVMMYFCVPIRIKRESHDAKIIKIANAFFVSLFFIALFDSLPYNLVLPAIIVAPVFIEYTQIWIAEYNSAG